MTENTEIIKSNCPRDCYDGCGISIEKINGRINRVMGDDTHPVSRGRLCNKCAIAYNGVWQDENERLLYPLKRTGDKGAGQFEHISWVEAIDAITDRLKQDIAGHGPESVIHTHYSGTLSLIALLFPMRFFLKLGASEVDPDSICNAAGHAALSLLYGESHVGFDPRTIKDSNCVLIWGANPSHTGPHSHKHWFAASSAKKIVVDPLRTRTARDADYHLQLRPGTDAALAFSLLHVMQREGLFDDGFISRHTLGSEELLPVIARCTPEWGARHTGVPAKLIEEAARCYAAGPSLLWFGQGFQRQVNGGNCMRSVGLLPAFTGNIGKPGTGFTYVTITPALAGLDFDAMAGAQLASAEPVSISHMDFAGQLSNPDRFKTLFVWNTNPVASAPNQIQLRRAMQREDLFTVVIDCFRTDSADYADIVLPAASFLEFDDLTFSYFHYNIGVQSGAMAPMGESLPNQEIFRRLAEGMDYTEEELFESDEVLIASMLEQMGVQGGFREFQQRGWQPISDEPVIPWSELQFPTPSGRIELASSTAESQGLPRIPQAAIDTRDNGGLLRLITPASDYRMNDSYANDPTLARNAGESEVYIHPQDAEHLGVVDGMPVTLRNDNGSLRLTASVDAIAVPGVLVSYKGRWPKQEQGHKNVNVLHTGQKADMAQSTSVHSTLVTLAANLGE
ncbi:MAG: molybdopterin-dependent oxidoreductase [Gammaproteobacteria bacterium]|nr:molybdopterin-dependent oxidoreductase [Gammaproteobacteria bacterium]